MKKKTRNTSEREEHARGTEPAGRPDVVASLATAMPVMVDAFDASGNIVFWNRVCEEVTGYRAEEIVGNPGAMEMLYPDPAYRRYVFDSVTGAAGDFRDMVFDLTCRDGTVRTISWSNISEFLPISGWATWAIGIDITEKRMAEERLKESESRFRALSEASFEAIFLSENGICLCQNKTAEILFGYTRNEAVGKPATDWIAPEYRDLVIKNIESRFEGVYEVVARRKNGSLFPVEIQARETRFQGKRVRVTALRDITARKITEQQLRDSEARFRTVLEYLPDAVFVMDVGGRFRLVNAAAEALTGYSVPELMQMSAFELDMDLLKNTGGKWIWKKLRASRFMRLESVVRRKDGTVFPSEIHLTATRIDGRDAALSVVRDISERKAAEARLRESEEKYRELFEAGSDAFFLIENETGRIVEANKTACDLYGYSRSEITRIRNTDLSDQPDETRRVTTQTPVRKGNRVFIPLRYHRKRDGTLFPVEITGRFFSWKGEDVHIAAVRDISEKIAAEEALAEIRDRYRRLFESLTSAFALHEMIYDDAGIPVDYRFLEVNRAFESMTGLKAGEILGKPVLSVLPGTDSFWIGQYGRVAETGESLTLDLEAWGKYYEVTAYSPKKGQFATIFQDITDRKREEEKRLAMERQMLQTQKLESLGVLAGGIAHDFNNILMAVMGHADMALNHIPEDSSARKNVGSIQKSVRRAADLCRQMLAYSGKGAFVVDKIYFGNIVHEMLPLLKSSISKKAEFHTHVEDNLPFSVGDPAQVRQVIMTLVVNASESLENREGTIRLSIKSMHMPEEDRCRIQGYHFFPDKPYVCVSVADTGSGMDEETKIRIFEPFFTTKFTGRGLGMAAVLGIARSCHGGLVFDSEKGKGSTFKVYFPAAGVPATGPAPSEKPASVSSDERFKGSGTVLLVDDEEAILKIGTEMLTSMGFDVAVAQDGREGVDVFRKQLPGLRLVLLDLAMPKMGGDEAFLAMKEIAPRIPVILSSGYAGQEISRRFEGLGIAGFIEKPYSLAALRDLVKKVLTEWSA